MFGPVIIVWFATIAVLQVIAILQPSVLDAPIAWISL